MLRASKPWYLEFFSVLASAEFDVVFFSQKDVRRNFHVELDCVGSSVLRCVVAVFLNAYKQ